MPKTVPYTVADAICQAFASGNDTRLSTGNRRQYPSPAAIVAASLAGLLACGPVHAIGLGELQVQSGLGHPLRATIGVLGGDPANRPASCYSARLSTADGGFIVSPRVALAGRGNGNGGMLTLATSMSLAEPAMSLVVEVACGDTVRKEFMLLLDPPLALAGQPTPDQAARAARPQTAVERPVSPPAPVAAAADSMSGRASAALPAAVPAIAARQSRARPAAAPAAATRPTSDRLQAAAAPAQKPMRNVLRMSARPSSADTDLINAIGLRLALADRLGNNAGALPATGSAADAASLAADRAARARFVEALRGDSGADTGAQATAQRLQQLQARTQLLEKETARLRLAAKQDAAVRAAAGNTYGDSPLLAGVVALLVASLAAVAWLVRRMRHLQRRNQDWDWEESVSAADARADHAAPADGTGFDAMLSMEEKAHAESAARAALNDRVEVEARELRQERSNPISGHPLEDAFWEPAVAPIVPPVVTTGTAAVTAPVATRAVELAAVATDLTERVPLTNQAETGASVIAPAQPVVAPALAALPFMLPPAMEQAPLLLPDLAFPSTPVAPPEFASPASLPVSGIALKAPARPPVLAAPSLPGPASAAAAGPGNLQFAEIRMQSTSAEEISDVMQEAEFWLSLRDLERAAEVLEPYATYEQSGSPLPWLYLFDLYRELGLHEKYDGLKDRFQRIFNGKALTWDEQKRVSPNAPQRGVEDVPHVALKLTALWQTEEILPYLEALLIDDRDGMRAGFDFAVYKEIMFLILLANEQQQSKQYLKPALGTSEAPVLA